MTDRISLKKAVLLSSVGTGFFISALALSAAPAYAQDAAKKPADAAPDTIVVTGSLLKRPDLESTAPVALVSAEDIKISGNARVEDLLNSLPQVFAAQGGNLSNGATGTATVSLRNLGASRTLVLVDGKRLQPGDLTSSAADLNFIPGALINRIDVLTGGASTTYGADAVAGVVNFVMNRKFEGVRIDANAGVYQHSNNLEDIRTIVDTSVQGYKAPRGNVVDGGTYDLTAIIGGATGDGKGHIVAYAGVRKNNAVRQDTRDYSVCTLNDNGPGQLACGGSNLAPAIVRIRGLNPANRALAGVTALGGNVTVDPLTNGLKSYQSGVDAFNFAPANYYLRPATRYTAGVFASYEINPHAEAYIDFMFMNNRTAAQIAPSGLFSGIGGNGWTVNCDNPFLNTGPTVNVPGVGARAVKAVAVCGADANVAGKTALNVLIGKRNTEGGPRFDDKGFTSFKTTVGLKGAITDNWSYDAYATIGRVEYTGVYNNDVSNAKIQRALNVVTDTRVGVPTSGQPVCQSFLDGTDPNCVPYNIFEVGKITQAALKYIAVPLFETGRTTEQIVNATVTGDIEQLKSPFADSPLALAFGAEYRSEKLIDEVDNSYLTGEGAGTGPKVPVSGGFNVKEVFTEFSLPLASDIPGFHKLELEGGYRYSSYKTSANQSPTSSTFKGAITWAPIPDVSFRASFNRAVRAPNLTDQFTPQVLGLWTGTDGCAGGVVGGKANDGAGFTLAQCQRTGVTAAQFGNVESNAGADQYNSLSRGTTTLTPEKANTFTVGAVLTPKSVLPGFSATIDYFSIKIDQPIGPIGGQYILNNCAINNIQALCNKIKRSKTTGSPGALFGDDNAYIEDFVVNSGSITTRGIDGSLNYKFDAGNSQIGFDVSGTYLLKSNFQGFTGGASYDCVGYHGTQCGTPTPKWRHRARVSYFAPSIFNASLTWRYTGSVRAGQKDLNADGSLNGTLPTGPLVQYADIKSYNYFDLAVGAAVTDKVKFRVGVNNILDKSPPVINSGATGAGSNGNTYSQVYDTLGRYFFVNVTTDF